MKKNVFALLMTLILGLPVFAAAYSVPVTPAAQRVSFPGQYEGSHVYFVKAKHGVWGMGVYADFYSGRNTTGSVGAFFLPTRGTIHRVGNQLYWSVNGREILVAHTYWYASVWITEKNVKLEIIDTPDYSQGSGFNDYNLSLKMSINENVKP